MAVAAKANIFPFSIPVPNIPASSSSSSLSSITVFASNFPHRHGPRPHRKLSSPLITVHAAEGISISRPMAAASTATTTEAPPPQRKEKQTESKERDAISILNERISRDYAGKREANSRPVMDSEEADRYIQLVKEQQQRGLQKLKGGGGGGGGDGGDNNKMGAFSYKADPYTLRSGDYVVHKKVGIGRFVGIKFDRPKDCTEPVEYVFIEYADGMAKLPVNQASRMLYRYNLLKQRRPPYPKSPAMAEFSAQFLYEPTPDQKQAFIDVEKDLTERETPMDRLICGDVGFGKTEVAIRAIFCVVSAGKQAMVLAPTIVLAKQHFDVISERFSKYPNIKVGLLSRFQTKAEKEQYLHMIKHGYLNIVVGTHALLGSRVVYNNLGLLVVDEEQRFGVKQKEQIASFKTSVDVLTLSATPIPRTLYLALTGFRDASLISTPPPQRVPIRTHLSAYKKQRVISAIKYELDRGGQVFYVLPRIKGLEEVMEFLQLSFPDVEVAMAHGKLLSSDLTPKSPELKHCVNLGDSGSNSVRVEERVWGVRVGGGWEWRVRGRGGSGSVKRALCLFFDEGHVGDTHGDTPHDRVIFVNFRSLSKQYSKQLEETMEKFTRGEIKILICTNIVESGLDIQNANTIIVQDVHHFGLAQLYQLRGRVGRADKEAHAHLLYPAKSLLSKEALERLAALEECRDLGQGFQLAERDMAIRGFGNIFGEQQTGDVGNVGIDLFFEMLFESLSKVDEHRIIPVPYQSVELDLNINLHLPSEYINYLENPMEIINKAEKAAEKDIWSLMQFTQNLRRQHGKEPYSMESLLKKLYVRRMAADLGITRIYASEKMVGMKTNMSKKVFKLITDSIASDAHRNSLEFEDDQIKVVMLVCVCICSYGAIPQDVKSRDALVQLPLMYAYHTKVNENATLLFVEAQCSYCHYLKNAIILVDMKLRVAYVSFPSSSSLFFWKLEGPP
ncbi:hypothetical protein RHMOL_Rhmol10G0000600 [Rhododendron molle]|uniref:Uncharacterized protein n=1 Tax=Rhododendron molle TaxID=49168 RepID=A0ACC0LY81_RHOML|nr:hypothetical protein RHMOL_Rhmol10G0000600 [Rhododendron molle]